MASDSLGTRGYNPQSACAGLLPSPLTPMATVRATQADPWKVSFVFQTLQSHCPPQHSSVSTVCLQSHDCQATAPGISHRNLGVLGKSCGNPVATVVLPGVTCTCPEGPKDNPLHIPLSPRLQKRLLPKCHCSQTLKTPLDIPLPCKTTQVSSSCSLDCKGAGSHAGIS